MKACQPPERLSVAARWLWFEVIRWLIDLGTLSMVGDPEELAAYCEAVAYQEQGPHDLLDEDWPEHIAIILDFSSKYGLNPASRARLGILNLPD